MGVFLRHRYICGLNVLLNFREAVSKVGGDWPLLTRQKTYCAREKTPVFLLEYYIKQWHCIGPEERKVFQLPYLNPGWLSAIFLIHH